MTELATNAAPLNSYDLPVPRMDGQKATHLLIGFSGSGRLDRTASDDLELLEAMRLGHEVRVIVTGSILEKGFTLSANGEELVFRCTVRVANVEAGEAA